VSSDAVEVIEYFLVTLMINGFLSTKYKQAKMFSHSPPQQSLGHSNTVWITVRETKSPPSDDGRRVLYNEARHLATDRDN